jgi:hypothetical protein
MDYIITDINIKRPCSPRDSCSAWCAMPATRMLAASVALAAAEMIQHIGAQPQVSLKELATKHGLPV